MAEQAEAGTYELIAERWDELVSKPGEPARYARHVRGDTVELDQEEAERLVAGGAVVKPGELQLAAAEAARQQYLATLSALPDSVREQFLGEQTPVEAADTFVADDPTGESLLPDLGPTSSDPATAVTSLSPEPTGGDRAVGHPARPAKAAATSAWVDYAVAQGADPDEAQKLDKKDLIARYGAE